MTTFKDHRLQLAALQNSEETEVLRILTHWIAALELGHEGLAACPQEWVGLLARFDLQIGGAEAPCDHSSHVEEGEMILKVEDSLEIPLRDLFKVIFDPYIVSLHYKGKVQHLVTTSGRSYLIQNPQALRLGESQAVLLMQGSSYEGAWVLQNPKLKFTTGEHRDPK
ncbi:hypothetical protein [Pseudobacteriovorax antillogorgiicola]|uniref:Uncharacterized protein n=1 Tax=Pseudobacteriovorax antillogorgiicola TaxID=1513793 RepID=A0A1Y6C971_9BACT|nr:hypothetical protein [Pseudobacteriovorax antillogorgiicola]TCS49794.1 hypothetical protein EDD56_11439 [Pseudobacteriovorax antillogorgiicola]SMF42975.1 hypothetical protein SAMN06296036_11338 [Pseudobacteriovorax antillogorgiicola]